MNYQIHKTTKPKLGMQTHIYQAFAADKSQVYDGRDLQKRLNVYQRQVTPSGTHTVDATRYVEPITNHISIRYSVSFVKTN